MTQEAYFEMCELFGQEPVEEDIPIALNDLSFQSQLAFEVYSYLPENWTQTAYLGKTLTGIKDIFELLDINSKYEQLLILKFVRVIDAHVSNKISQKISEEQGRRTH